MSKKDKLNQNTSTSDHEKQHSNYDLFILALTLMSLLVMALFFIPWISPAGKEVAYFLDTFISLIFMADFFRSLIKAPRKLEYLKWGWMDFLGSLPAWPIFRLFRIWRLFRAVRILHHTSVKELWHSSVSRRAESSLLITALLAILVLGFSSFAILEVEQLSPEANIVSAQDAIWWSLVSVTTVGYGDRFPVTYSGRWVAVLLMTAGIGLFSIITSYLSSLFIAPVDDNGEDNEIAQLRTELAEIKQLLQELNGRLPEQQA